MIRSAVTVCLVPEARRGPFVFHQELDEACEKSAALGFDAVEIFASSGTQVDPSRLSRLLTQHDLGLAAVGTGAGMVLHGLSLCDSDRDLRAAACRFVKDVINFGAVFGCPAIIGSMQGRTDSSLDKDAALGNLAASLEELAGYAGMFGQNLLFEPLNRYETDLVNTLSDGAGLLESVAADNLLLLADLFHMNIEEASIAGAIQAAGDKIGHVHFVDSNRRAAGLGHLQFEPIADALAAAEYDGYASAEAFPLPDSDVAASMTMQAFKQYLRGPGN